MQESLSITFPVRGNEIGPGMSVTLGGLARYCEWSRWAVFREERAAFLRPAFKGGVARAQTLEVHGAFTYPGDAVIDVWIARVGRTSLDFGHELRTAEGALVARARVTIVQLGESGPEPFPAWLADHVTARETASPLALPEGPFEDAFEHGWRVRPSDLDQFGHVNQARYVDHADDTRLFAHHAGHPAGFSGGVRAITVSYERELRAPAPVRARLRAREDGTREVVLLTEDGRVANRAALRPA